MPPSPIPATALTHAHTRTHTSPGHTPPGTHRSAGHLAARPHGDVRASPSPNSNAAAYSPVSRLVRQPLCVVMPCMIMPAAASIARRPLAISFVRICIVSLKPSGLKPKSPASRSPLSRPAVVATPLITIRSGRAGVRACGRAGGRAWAGGRVGAVNSCAGTRAWRAAVHAWAGHRPGHHQQKSIAAAASRLTFDDSEEGERSGDVVRVLSPDIPEDIHLRLALTLRL